MLDTVSIVSLLILSYASLLYVAGCDRLRGDR